MSKLSRRLERALAGECRDRGDGLVQMGAFGFFVVQVVMDLAPAVAGVSWPASTMGRADSGLRSSARATVKMVAGSLR